MLIKIFTNKRLFTSHNKTDSYDITIQKNYYDTLYPIGYFNYKNHEKLYNFVKIKMKCNKK